MYKQIHISFGLDLMEYFLSHTDWLQILIIMIQIHLVILARNEYNCKYRIYQKLYLMYYSLAINNIIDNTASKQVVGLNIVHRKRIDVTIHNTVSTKVGVSNIGHAECIDNNIHNTASKQVVIINIDHRKPINGIIHNIASKQDVVLSTSIYHDVLLDDIIDTILHLQ